MSFRKSITQVMNSPSGVRIKAPKIGPKSVPTPPTMGARVTSIERSMANVDSGNRLLL